VVVGKYFPDVIHHRHKGELGTVRGQGELKATGRDPLFWINHTLAMLRAKVSRLHRRSWNLSKNIDSLEHHLAIYTEAHNRRIWKKMLKTRTKNSVY